MGAPDKELELEFDFDMEIDEEPKDEESKGDIKPECMIYLKKLVIWDMLMLCVCMLIDVRY